MQTAGNLVAVLIKLAAGMKLGHHNFSSTPLWLVLIVILNTGWYATAIINNRNRVIRVNNYRNFRAITRQGLVNRVIENLKNQMVQTCSVGGVSDVHAWTFTNSFETL